MTIKFAFIHHPHAPEAARLETMPFAINSVRELAKLGTVDLFLWEDRNEELIHHLPQNINIKFLRRSMSHRRARYSTQFILKYWKKYSAIFALGQIGAHLGNLLAKKINCPLIYYNDEFPSHYEKSAWTQLEKNAAQRASLIVVPDQSRIEPLEDELELPNENSKFSVLPNITIINNDPKKINWHERFNINKDMTLVLNAGTLADWAQIPEILSSVPLWPENVGIIMHTRKSNIQSYLRGITHLEIPEKVFWSTDPLPEDNLNSLVSYCTASFALYRNTGPNIEHIGFSSGKLMRSLACGTPVIASKLPSLDFIEKYRLGSLVKHPIEIPDAIKIIQENLAEYRQNCLEFVKEKVDFNIFWGKFARKLKGIM